MMRLSVSNLAWPAEQEAIALSLLKKLGAVGVEVAPTRIAPWDEITDALLTDYRGRVEDAGLSVSSLQAVLFGRPELKLLETDNSFSALCEHIQRVSHIAGTLGASVMVFGAPRNRLRGDMDAKEASDLACERLHRLGNVAAEAGATIGVEPVPSVYEGDFLTHWSDVLAIVREIDHPGVRVHLDTGCVFLGGDAIDEAIPAAADWLTHFHIAEPQLGSFATPMENHLLAARGLHDIGYNRWIAIEMREQNDDPIGALKTAVEFARQTYIAV